MYKTILNSMLLAAVAGTSAVAGSLNYTLTDSNDSVKFSISQQPTVTGTCNRGIDCFSVAGVTVTDSSQSWLGATVDFYTNANGGGLAITASNGNLLLSEDGPLVNNVATQLFSGSLSAPTLLSFTNLQLANDPAATSQLGGPFVLNATTGTATPEPGAMGLIAAGAAFLAYFRKRHS